MKSIISKGKDVDDAVNLGLELMEVPKSKVSIEVIERGKRRLLKLLSKEAVVKLTRTTEKRHVSPIDNLIDEILDAEEEENVRPKELEPIKKVSTDEFHGKVWIKEGKIFCKTSKDNFPSLKIPESMIMLINGEVFQGKSLVLSEKETYELKSDIVEKEIDWEITMNSLKTEAYLNVEPGYKVEYEILDAEPSRHLELAVVESKQIQNTLQFEDVVRKMTSLGINYGLNHSGIIKAIKATEPGKFIIAEGKLPKEGENGWFETKVNTEVQVGPKEKDDGRVDYRESKSIPNVEQGKVIGIIHPATDGKIGYTVTGLPIPAKRSFPLKVRSGNGIAVIGNEIIAKESGRPEIERKGLLTTVKIVSKLIHVSNVDLTSGNITFKGDVEIFGAVTNQMLVEATGDIEIHKIVDHSVVNSNRGVILHNNCLGSEIIAGVISLGAERITQLKQMSEMVSLILQLLEKLTSSESYKKSEHYSASQRPLIRRLVEQRVPQIPQLVKSFAESLSEIGATFENRLWKMISDSLSQQFLLHSTKTVTLRDVQQLSLDMEALIAQSSEEIPKEAYIIAPNAMSSELYSSGDISITGQGCINTKIQAGGYVHILGTARGGEVYGAMGVTIGVAGSLSSNSTVIAVPHDKKIRIDKALEGVILKIGQEVYKFPQPAIQVHAYINGNGKLIVE